MHHLTGAITDEINPSVQLAQLVMAATAVGEDLNAVKTHVDMGAAK